MSTYTSRVRTPAVAGLFYPKDAEELSHSVEAFLSDPVTPDEELTSSDGPIRGGAPKALIAPHAGYIYSGSVAAKAYRSVSSRADLLRRIVLIGPSHRVWFDGVAIPFTKAFATPLGVVNVAAQAVEQLRTLPMVLETDQPHALEHSLEVHLPFLQRMAPAAEIVPIVTGEASPQEVEQVIESVWGGPETLIVISSDLSHYHPYATARVQDESTAQAILDERDDLTGEQACGCVGINGMNRIARKRGLHAEVLDLRNSGDTAGDKRRVVGYGAFGFYDA